MNRWGSIFRNAFCCVLLCLLFVPAQAQRKKKVAINAPRPKVGVVLGGGGAKGAAHIGVLKYLEEVGIPVDYVAGTSMGSIIGGLYAMGYSPDELAKLIANMNWSEYVGNTIERSAMSPEMRQRNSTMFMNIPFSLSGIFKNKAKGKTLANYLPSAYVNNTALINLFNDLCIGYQEEVDFNDLPIPFACVATDIATGKEVVIRHGSVPNAMRASMAIPGVFSPVRMDGKVLVDGGLVNNFPADVLHEMGADIIIGVEVSDKLTNNLDEIPSLPEVLSYVITNAVGQKRDENRKLCTLYLDPDITGYGTLSFTPDAIDTLVRRGYERAVQNREQLLRIKEYVDKEAGHPVTKTLQAPRAKNLEDNPVFVSTITINQVGMERSKWLARKGGLEVGKYITSQEIQNAVAIYRGTGAFNDITYNLYESDLKIPGENTKAYQLVLDFKPTLPHIVGIGTRYDTEEGAAMQINLGLNEKRLSGFKLNLTGRLSYNPRFNATATYSMIPVANFNLAYDYRSQNFKVKIQDQRKNANLHYAQHRASAYLSQFQIRNINSEIGFAYMSTKFDQSGFFQSDNYVDNRLFGPFVNAQYDNLDHSYFARNGFRSKLSAHLYLDPENNGRTAKDVGFSYEHYITPGGGRFTIIPQLYSRLVLGDNPYANLRNTIGGDIPGRHVDHQMPFIGVSHLNEASELAAVMRCDLRYNFLGKHYITATYNTLFGYNFPEDDNTSTTEWYSGVGLRYAYNTPIGPAALTAQWSDNTNQFSMYFSLGYNF
jgi:NTE family protein